MAAPINDATMSEQHIILQWTKSMLPWMRKVHSFRKRLFLRTIEPIIVLLVGPMEDDNVTAIDSTSNTSYGTVSFPSYYFGAGANTTAAAGQTPFLSAEEQVVHHRRLSFLPDYISDISVLRETSMSFATLVMLFVTMSAVFVIFLSCFYHNQVTSPLFISPRRHRLPKLVPPPLPVQGYFSWVKVCFYMSDEEIINRVGYDSLIFLRFHRLALRCIVKMSFFSFLVLLPLNFTGGGHANADDAFGYVGAFFFTDFLRFTMANVVSGSPRLWVHCFGAYLLTAIVVRELLIEYETFNSIRHRYLLSREPHLRTVLVSNIPRHLRSSHKITNYFKNVYPDAVKSVIICQNLLHLENLVQERTKVLARIESEVLLLCRKEKRKLYKESWCKLTSRHCKDRLASRLEEESLPCCMACCTHCCGYLTDSPQERLAAAYAELEDFNMQIEQEQRRRRRIMKMLDKMPAGNVTSRDLDYVLTAPYLQADDAAQRRVLGLQNDPKQQSPTPSQPWQYPDSEKAKSSGAGGSDYQPPTMMVSPLTSMESVQEKQQHPDTIPEVNESAGDSSSSNPTTVETITQPELIDSDPSSPVVPQSQLRSRSPHGTKIDGKPQLGKKAMYRNSSGGVQMNKDRAKARSAITQYGRFDQHHNNNVSFLGRPVAAAPADSQTQAFPAQGENEMYIEDHINEVTDKAFVVFSTFTAATVAIQSMHSSKPGSMQVSTAPEPRDILWQNIYVSKGAHRTRSYIGEFAVLLIITFYIVPIGLVSLLVSESALISSSPRLAQLDQASAFFSACIASVQPLCVVILQQLLPPLFMFVGKAEGLVAFSEVQMRAFSRYFMFQVLNIFLVTTIAGSIFDTIAIIIETPESAFEMLGKSLPGMSSFFITFVIIKAFFGLGLEMVRTMSLVQGTIRYLFNPNATLRAQRNLMAGMRAIDDPGWFAFHKILAQDMLVVVISVVFAVVAPLVLLPCALFCLIARIMWTHHHLYVYESVFESGGQFWPKIFRRFVFGLTIGQMTITGQFILKNARHQAYATIALMVMTYFFLRSTRARYDPTAATLPLEVATVMDISLQQEEAAVAAQRQGEQKSSRGQGRAGVAHHHKAPTEQQRDGEAGALIGNFDPFRKAYLQPALRANPRARPEQPFPPAQLGREGTAAASIACERTTAGGFPEEIDPSFEVGMDDSSDTRATVRLKSLNQHDRRLINRWWDDQLQRAGSQNLIRVLTGEECGTLTMSSSSENADLNYLASGGNIHHLHDHVQTV